MQLLKTMSQLFKPETNADSSKPAASPARVTYVTPVADILETKDGFVLEAEMPGVNREGLQVTIDRGELTIVGRRTAYQTSGTTLHRESRADDYRRVFEIDSSIDTDRITAKIESGILTLNLPKTEAVKPRTIEVTD